MIKMKISQITFILGLLMGLYVPRMLAKHETKFVVGDCLSNGLFFERVTAIKRSGVTLESIYETQPTIGGHLAPPDSTVAWIVNDRYVKVSNRNCL